MIQGWKSYENDWFSSPSKNERYFLVNPFYYLPRRDKNILYQTEAKQFYFQPTKWVNEKLTENCFCLNYFGWFPVKRIQVKNRIKLN